MTERNTTHLAGEFLVAGELARRGYPVSITMGNAKSVDIYAESASGVLKIDAKAGRAKGNWPITSENVQADVFYIFVHLQSSQFHINHSVPLTIHIVHRVFGISVSTKLQETPLRELYGDFQTAFSQCKG